MASGFQNFLNDTGAETEAPKSYEDYSKKVWGTGGEIASAQTLTDKELGLEGLNPEQKFAELKNQYETLKSLTTNAKIANDPEGHGLRNLLSSKLVASEKEPPVVRVELPDEVVRKNGGKAKDVVFGAKQMNSEADKELITRQFNTAREYLDKIELHFVKGKDGKETAIVVGADARQFNAVITAESKQEKLAQMLGKAPRSQEQEQAVSSPMLDLEKLKALSASLPSKTDPDREASIAPLSAMNPQRQLEKAQSGGISA